LSRTSPAACVSPGAIPRSDARLPPSLSGKIVIVPRGHKANIEITGDEAQIFVRDGEAHVGVSGHRYEAGRRLEEALAPDVFLLTTVPALSSLENTT
jgi:hypothetical protein